MMYSPTFSGSTDVLFFFPTVCLFVCLFVLSLIPLGQLRRTRSGAESYHNSNRITFKTLQNWRAYAEGITMMTTSPWPLAPPYTRDMHNYTVWMPAGVSSVEVRCFSLGQAMLPRCHALRAVYRTPRRHTYATASVLIGLVRVPPPPSAARPPPPRRARRTAIHGSGLRPGACRRGGGARQWGVVEHLWRLHDAHCVGHRSGWGRPYTDVRGAPGGGQGAPAGEVVS